MRFLKKFFKWVFIFFLALIALHFIAQLWGAEEIKNIPECRQVVEAVNNEVSNQMDFWEGRDVKELREYWGKPNKVVKYDGFTVFLYFIESINLDNSYTAYRIFWINKSDLVDCVYWEGI